MAVLQMQKFSICALKKDRPDIIEMIQRLGRAEISQDIPEDEAFAVPDTSKKTAFEKDSQKAEQALAVLDEFAPEKKGMFAGMAGKTLITTDDGQAYRAQEDAIRATVDELLSLKKKITEQYSEINRLDGIVLGLEPWMDLDVPMDLIGTGKTSLILGSMPGIWSMDQVLDLLAQDETTKDDPVDVTILSADKNQTCMGVLCMKRSSEDVEDVLRRNGLTRPQLTYTKTPREVKAECADKETELQKEIAGETARIQELSDQRDELQFWADHCGVYAQRTEVLSDVKESRQTFVMSGFIPKEDAPALEKKLQNFDLALEFEDAPREESPVKLKNNGFSKNFEGILASYGLPGPHDIDPTTIMSFFYVFLFGLMLSDAAYGALITVVCFILIRKFPRMSDSMSNALHLFMYCGISTLFWGIMFGGYFGDVVNVVSKTWGGHEVGIPPLWFEPLSNPMRLLMWCMLFGLIHLFTGLAIKGYMDLKQKDVLGFFGDVVFWYAFLIGLILMLLPTEMFSSMAQINFAFPDWLKQLSRILAIIGAVGILCTNGRGHKNIAVRIALGLYGLYDITGWLSDVLSYSRLLALGLATGVIAQVVNQMGSMAGGSIGGLILFIIVFIIGHVFNMAINILGAYVHTNRLQYVEFFGKFYEGGGRPFDPFIAKTKYTELKED